MSLSDDTVYYEIVTRYWEPTITKINKRVVMNDNKRMVSIAQIHDASPKNLKPKSIAFRIAAKDGDRRTAVDDKEQMEALGDGIKVRFKGSWMDVDDFIKYDDRIGASFKGEDGSLYTWRSQGGKLQLIKPDDKGGCTLLAQYHDYKRFLFVLRMSQHAFLEIRAPEVVDSIMDRLIVSYILVERKRRQDGKSSLNSKSRAAY